MATDELLELFSLESSSSEAPGSDSGPAPSKKRRATVSGVIAGGIGGDKWSLEELWDGSQYEQQHSITSFLKQANQ